jgi:hypothetical protein
MCRQYLASCSSAIGGGDLRNAFVSPSPSSVGVEPDIHHVEIKRTPLRALTALLSA